MTARKNAERVRVRGLCPEGHVTETLAPRRRTTWSGQCTHDGCELPVTCRRIPSTEGAPPEVKPVTLASGVKVRRVAGYAERGRGGESRVATKAARPVGGGKRRGAAAAEEGAGGDEPVEPVPAFEPGRADGGDDEPEVDELFPD